MRKKISVQDVMVKELLFMHGERLLEYFKLKAPVENVKEKGMW